MGWRGRVTPSKEKAEIVGGGESREEEKDEGKGRKGKNKHKSVNVKGHF